MRCHQLYSVLIDDHPRILSNFLELQHASMLTTDSIAECILIFLLALHHRLTLLRCFCVHSFQMKVELVQHLLMSLLMKRIIIVALVEHERAALPEVLAS